jgi:hypothetical protein
MFEGAFGNVCVAPDTADAGSARRSRLWRLPAAERRHFLRVTQPWTSMASGRLTPIAFEGAPERAHGVFADASP